MLNKSNKVHSLPRRFFLQGLATAGAGLAVVPSLSFASDLMASDKWLLPSRAGKPELRLHYNENSLGMSPKAAEAARKAMGLLGNRYPDKYSQELRCMLAEQHKVMPEQILFGNGSSELLGSAVALLKNQSLGQDAVIVEPTPTFGGARSYARTHGVRVISVPVGKGFVTDIQALQEKTESLGSKTQVLVNICNPNNPTGTIADSQRLMAWINAAPDNVMFLVDEAYFEYANIAQEYQSALPLVLAGKENLFVTRTFSKIYGMAGLRVGYGFAAPDTARKLKGFSADWNLNVAGIGAAIASLQDEIFYASSLNSNQKAKAIIINTLDELKLEYIPTYTNFLLHRIDSDLSSYSTRMQANGIKVGRRMTKDDGWNRLSIGTPQQMLEFSNTIKGFREKGWV